jgi:hypothetical protein
VVIYSQTEVFGNGIEKLHNQYKQEVVIMLACSCGWKGVNLVPSHKEDTARCPQCSMVFEGIPAENASVVSSAENDNIVIQAEADLANILIAQELIKQRG